VISGLSTRPATPGERDALEALQWRASQVWDEYRDLLLAHPDAIDLPAEQIVEGRAIVAELEARIVGFAVVLPRQDGGAELDGLFVEPSVWRMGVGTRLIADAELLAAAGGANFLHVIANPLAEGFYRSCGFVLTGEESTRFGVARTMRKTICKSRRKTVIDWPPR
jgi:GNAT superfamily N-acetyltransferase